MALLGNYWHTTIRHGVAGQRAKLGELTFDTSDVAQLEADARDFVRGVALVAAVEAIGSVRASHVGFVPIETIDRIAELCADQAWNLARPRLLARFGIAHLSGTPVPAGES